MSKFSRDTLHGALRDVRKKDNSSYTVIRLMDVIDYTLKIEADIDVAMRNRKTYKKSESKMPTGALVGGSRVGKQKSGGPIRNACKGKECVLCDGNTHNTYDCTRFKTLNQRRGVLIKKGLCFICLKRHHRAECNNSDIRCPSCNKVGHSLVTCVTHIITLNKRMKTEREDKDTEAKASSFGTSNSGTFLQTFACRVRNPKVANSLILIRGLLDPGSLRSYIDESICRKLNLQSRESNSMLCYHFGSSVPCEIEAFEFDITTLNQENKCRTYTFISTPCITGKFRTFPSPSLVKSVLPGNLKYADPDIFSSDQQPLEILIDADLHNQFVDLTETERLPNEITLLNSFFGMIPFGRISEYLDNSCALIAGSLTEQVLETISSKNHCSDFSDLSDLNQLWSLEMIGIRSSELDNEYDRAVEQFCRSVKESFVVGLGSTQNRI